MGWMHCGKDSLGRDIGYGASAHCDQPECNAEIDRGLGHVCGDMHGGGEYGCGKYFCGSHLYFVASEQRCELCKERGVCPDCEGMGELTNDEDWDTVLCDTCDGEGYLE
jgi:hypothetical protein